MGFSDRMLDSGCARHTEAAHGESITIMSGPQTGMTFICVKEIESDVVFNGEVVEDLRSKRIIRFRNTRAVPAITSQTIIRTADGKLWNAVRAPQDGYLTTDFELREIVAGIDT